MGERSALHRLPDSWLDTIKAVALSIAKVNGPRGSVLLGHGMVGVHGRPDKFVLSGKKVLVQCGASSHRGCLCTRSCIRYLAMNSFVVMKVLFSFCSIIPATQSVRIAKVEDGGFQKCLHTAFTHT